MLFYIEKEENLSSILMRLQKEKAASLSIVIPEYALVTKSSLNFKIIKETASQEKKKIDFVTTDKVAEQLIQNIKLKVREKAPTVNEQEKEEVQEEKETPEEVSAKEEIIPMTSSENKEEQKLSDQGSEGIKKDNVDLENPKKEVEKISPEETQPKKLYPKTKSFPKLALFFVIFSVLFLGGLGAFAYFFLPKATVEIILAGKDLSSETKITVDVGAVDMNTSTKTIPGTVVTAEETAQKTADATGKKEVGEKASGNLTIQNYTLEDILFPSGTTFTVYQGQTGAGLVFLATSGITVPAGQETVEQQGNKKITTTEAGTASIPVIANEIGSTYNLQANTNFLVGTEAYSLFKAINPGAFTGGSSQEVTVVTQADLTNLAAQLTAELKNKAETDLQSKLVGDQKIIKSTIVFKELSQVYDKDVDVQADKVTLTMTSESRVTSYSESELIQLVVSSVTDKAPEGYFVQEDDLQITPELAKAETNGNLVFTAKVNTTAYPLLETGELKKALMGIKPAEAEAYLKGMDKVLGYNISVWPPLPPILSRMPFLDNRLEIKTTIQGQ